MKFTFVKNATIFFFLFGYFMVLAQVDVEYIWGGPNAFGAEYDNSTFNGGLNDWTTEGLECEIPDSTYNAVWRWDENGVMAGGEYWLDEFAIKSPSVANGAVGFDSDYYNYSGVAPAPQKSVLTSPSMDCTGENEVSLMFYESFRTYQAISSVEVSNDDGVSWVSYPIRYNDLLPHNEPTGIDAWTYVDISPTAANQANVQIRFVWDGDYYYWIIDDVALIKSPQYDLAIFDYDYPFRSYSVPLISGIGCKTLNFGFEISNIAQVEVENVVAKVQVKDESGGVIYEESKTLAAVSGSVTTIKVIFEDWWLPALDEGIYYLEYSIGDGTQDFNPDDNMVRRPFVVSHNTFSLGEGEHIVPFPASCENYYAHGCFYNTCDFDNTTGSLELAVDSIGIGVVGANVDSFPNSHLNISIFDGAGPMADWEKKGSNDYHFTSNLPTDTVLWVTDFKSSTGDDVEIVLEPNKKYVVLASSFVPDNGSLRMYFTESEGYPIGKNILIVDGSVYSGYENFKASPYIVMKLKFLTNSSLPKLPDYVVTIVQNPVQDELSLKLDFAHTMDVSYAIGTLNGSLLQTGQWKNAQSETQILDVSNLTNGQYLIRVQTDEGIVTKLFVVARW